MKGHKLNVRGLSHFTAFYNCLYTNMKLLKYPLIQMAISVDKEKSGYPTI